MTKRVVVFSLCAFTLLPVMGQDAIEAYKKQKKKEFTTYVQNKQQQLDEYRRKKNQEFAAYMEGHKWEAFDKKKAIEQPLEKDVPPVFFDEKEGQQEEKEFSVEIVPFTKPDTKPQPMPIAPIKENDETKGYSSFIYYGTTLKVRWGDLSSFHLQGNNEKAMAKAYRQLTNAKYDNLLHDCLELRTQYDLCDWAYLQMLGAMASTVCRKGTNEAVFLQGLLFHQSGYAVRFAIDPADKKLHLLVRIIGSLYDHDQFVIDKTTWFSIEKTKSQKLHICDKVYEGEQSLRLDINKLPKLQMQASQSRIIKSESYSIKVNSMVNKNLIDFMNDYPTSFTNNNFLTRWAYYANTPVSKEIREKVYPQLKKYLQNATEQMAVNILLNFVQTGFVYEYDSKVWGQDRAFFAEETLYYPFSDCEDRSILFSHLVRDLLGLDVALIYYPEHMATAVCFTTPFAGDYVMIGNRKFIICDPTYIRASAGKTMPQYKNVKAQAILCNR